MLYNYFINVILVHAEIGKDIRLNLIKNDVHIYEVICITENYGLSLGEKCILLLPKIGNGMIYIISYTGVLLAKLNIKQQCVVVL